MREEWKDVKGYEGLYQVSNFGRIRRVETGKIKEPSDKKCRDGSNGGYLAVRLYKDNIGKNCYVHRLVAEAFIPNPENKETVNHKDGNKQNNALDNLEWATYSENNYHAYKHDLIHQKNKRTSIPVNQYDLDMNLIKQYPSMREAERQTGIECASISSGARRGWRCGGYIWRLAT